MAVVAGRLFAVVKIAMPAATKSGDTKNASREQPQKPTSLSRPNQPTATHDKKYNVTGSI